MRTQSVCPCCNQSTYLPLKTTYNEAPDGNRELSLELLGDGKIDMENLARLFPPNGKFTIEIAERNERRILLRTVFITDPTTNKTPAAPGMSLKEMQDNAVMLGITGAEKMDEEQIKKAMADRVAKIEARSNKGRQPAKV